MADANSFNMVILLGHITDDPELDTVKEGATKGRAYCKFGIATNEAFTKPKKPKTEYHRCVAWGKTAEFISEYIKKGRQVLAHGKLRHRKFTGREGDPVYMTEVNVERIVGIGKATDKPKKEGEDPF